VAAGRIAHVEILLHGIGRVKDCPATLMGFGCTEDSPVFEADNRLYRMILVLLYATGVRRTEAARIKVEDIDSKRMVIHIRQGKGARDRDVPLSPKLLEELRSYWQWKKPRGYLFPSTAGQREFFFTAFDFLFTIRRSSYDGGAWVSPVSGLRRIKTFPLSGKRSYVGQLMRV
jgi:integrase